MIKVCHGYVIVCVEGVVWCGVVWCGVLFVTPDTPLYISLLFTALDSASTILLTSSRSKMRRR
jgi:hypothetical protein